MELEPGVGGRALANMVFPEQLKEAEQRLLNHSKKFDAAVREKDIKTFESLLSDAVTLHKDNLTIYKNLDGKAAVVEWMKSYFDKYEYEHDDSAGAVDDDDNTAFCFWQDRNVRPKPDKFFEDLPDWAKRPNNVVGIWHHILDSENKIQDIFYLRQLSKDEVYRKLKNPPDLSNVKFDPSKFRGAPFEPSAERRQLMEKGVRCFNEIWSKGKPEEVDSIFTPDAELYDPVFGVYLNGKDAIKDHLKTYTEMRKKEWEVKHEDPHWAVTAGNKGFLHWFVKAVHKTDGQQEVMYGLDMMVFTKDAKIREVVSFRMPPDSEARRIVKDERLLSS